MRRIWATGLIVVALACLGGVAAGSAHAYVPDGTQGWYWQMPQPAAGLVDVTFASAHDVWAVGVGGVILHSTDAGQTWAAQQSGTLDDLDSVSFADAQHGWAAGGTTVDDPGPNVVLATTNGGATWTDRSPSGLAKTLTNVSFADDQHGWAGTTSGFAVRTTNGGVTWTTKRVGAAKGELDVSFVSAAKGWATEDGRVLWRTTNGGAAWSVVHRFASPGIVDFTDASHGWAALVSAGQSISTSILTTSDAGAHWRTAHRFANAWSFGFRATTRLDAAFVGAVTDGSMVSDPLAGSSTLSATTDGGKSWTTRHIGRALAPTAIAGRGSALCAVGEGIAASADAGASWRAASSGQHYWINDGVAVSASDLWAVDEGGALLHSTDGRRWAEQPGPVRWSQELGGLSFPDATNGWLVGSSESVSGGGVIFHTSDGGATWGAQASSLGGELVGVDFVDDTSGWAISDDPWGSGSGAVTGLERTTDGGMSWLAQYVSGNPALTAIDFVDATTGWVGGSASDSESTVVYKTTNGGQSWAAESLPKGLTDLTGLQFLDQNEGWAVGSNFSESSGHGWLLHTTNGGVTWGAAATLPAGLYADAVHFLDSRRGWVGGTGVWATTDGGATWAKAAGGEVEAIAATDAAHVWAFGDGIVATADDSGGDTAPPQTLDSADWAWHRRPVTIALTANDAGGSGVKATQFSSDGGSTWQPGTAIAVPAPTNHANDGGHTFLYRSTDNAGNTEATEICGVGIDTVGPVCGAPKNLTAGFGKSAIVRFKAADATSGVAAATVRIETRGGRVVRTLVARSGRWDMYPEPSYLWLRFTCKLKPGLYRVVVRAVDRAGNRQAKTGRGWLRVVRRGAPKATPPYWPSGLPVGMAGWSGRKSTRSLRAEPFGSTWGELAWQLAGTRSAVTGM
jgi:photosystem II stability/assembly factor-like uncharacterized protein